MRSASFAAAAMTAVLALGACGGDSKEDKAKTKVCDARDDISKQVDTLKGLNSTNVSVDAVTKPLSAIQEDLKTIAGAQGDLSSDRRSAAETAVKTFTSSVASIAQEAISSLSAADAKQALVTALSQLGTSFKAAFDPVDCG